MKERGPDIEKDIRDLVSESATLFGNVEELDPDEVVSLLNDSGPPASAIRAQMFTHVEKLVQDMRLRGESVPQRYVDAMNHLRPPSNLPQNHQTLVEHAKRCVAELLQPQKSPAVRDLRFAFHRKAELTAADQKILKETECEVLSRIRKR